MQKYKRSIIILSVVLGLALTHVIYFTANKAQSFFRSRTPSSLAKKAVALVTYSSKEIGLEVKYPESWTVKEENDLVEINPQKEGGGTHFSVGLRKEFKSLEEVKRLLSPDISVTPVQFANASGFKYQDTDFREVNWILHANDVYVIRVYPRSQEAGQILQSLKFIE